MAKSIERPIATEEKDRLKFGALTAALGLAAVVGSLAIPTHNNRLRDLQISVDAAGAFVFLKGAIQALDTIDQTNS